MLRVVAVPLSSTWTIHVGIRKPASHAAYHPVNFFPSSPCEHAGQFSEASGNEGFCYFFLWGVRYKIFPPLPKSVLQCPESLWHDFIRAPADTAALSIYLTLLPHKGLSGSDS